MKTLYSYMRAFIIVKTHENLIFLREYIIYSQNPLNILFAFMGALFVVKTHEITAFLRECIIFRQNTRRGIHFKLNYEI